MQRAKFSVFGGTTRKHSILTGLLECLPEAVKGIRENDVVSSHMLSNMALSDRILVLEKGRLVEDGTQEELLRN